MEPGRPPSTSARPKRDRTEQSRRLGSIHREVPRPWLSAAPRHPRLPRVATRPPALCDYPYRCFRLSVPLFPIIRTVVSDHPCRCFRSSVPIIRTVISNYPCRYFQLPVPLFPTTRTVIFDHTHPYHQEPSTRARPPARLPAAAPRVVDLDPAEREARRQHMRRPA
jgi:hypothetical protein